MISPVHHAMLQQIAQRIAVGAYYSARLMGASAAEAEQLGIAARRDVLDIWFFK